ncbi:MAG: hypothetical protein E6H94_11920, partial [Chloroflexi bacterium]
GQRSAEARGSELARQVQRAGSRAGRGAVAARTGVAVYVTVLPNDTDPDDLARRDPDRMRGLLGEAKPVLEFVIDRIAARSDLGGPEGRRRFLAEALPLVGDEPDPLTRELYVGTLSRLTGVEQESLRREAAAAPSRPTRTTQDTGGRGAKPPDWPPDVRTKQTASLERYVMALLTRFPEEAARADLAPTDLDDPDLRALLIELRSGKHSTSDLPAQLAATAAALSASALELGDEVEPGREIERAALRLREQNLRRRFEDARARLARGEGGGAGALDGEVAQLASELDELMKRRERSTVLQAADLEQRIE